MLRMRSIALCAQNISLANHDVTPTLIKESQIEPIEIPYFN